MPELPEVESIKRSLSSNIVGQNLENYKIYDHRTNRYNTKKPKIKESLSGISRKGKLLIFDFEHYSIIFHLGMSGRIQVNDKKNKHTRARFYFHKDTVNFDDIRRFGFINIINAEYKIDYLNKIGPDVLEINTKQSRIIIDKSKKSKSLIKDFILNQKYMSGIGNIYANEILFASRIHPETKVNDLSSNNWIDFFNNTKKIMQLAIKNNGTTLSDMTYFLPYGEFGSNQKFLKIYSKTNCFNCEHIIDKIYINQRATYFCRKCQKLKN
ncbi:MAG: bifunctional DNA-formamidopyrimidine glycosylase/DNA-(apurinic or apyrimidinic site) lyase [Candidatus Actinomarina sp.]|jgi:formamidopyrimidine-DNA glycosylase